MKHLILLLLALTLSIGIVSAQAVIGIKGGLNVSRIAGRNATPSADSQLGVHAGIMMQTSLMKSLIIQPELLYTQKGFNYQFNISEGDTKVRNSLDYVEVPLLLKLNFVSNDIKVQPYAGPAVSYLIRANSKRIRTTGTTTVTTNDNISDQINKLGFGVAVGAEVIYLQKYLLGARYNFGVSNIYKNDTEEVGSGVRNGCFMLSLGYLFSGVTRVNDDYRY